MFQIFKKLGWFFKLRWKTYLIGVLALGITAALSSITPLILGRVIDQMAQKTITGAGLIQQVLLLLACTLIMYGLRYVWRISIFGNSTLLESIMRNRLFAHFTRMDSQFFHRYRTGDLMAHATNDLAALRFVAGGGILTLADSTFQGGITLCSMLFLIDWKLTLYTILPFPLLVIAARYLGSIINRRFRLSLQAFSQMNDQVNESVAGIKVIKTFGEEADDHEDFMANTTNVVDQNRKVHQVDAAYRPVIDGITGLTYVLTLFFGTMFIYQGRITVGQLVSYFSYLSMMAWPLLAVGRLVNTMERGNASWDRIAELLSETSHIIEADEPISQTPAGDISFSIAEFAYPDAPDHPELENVHFHLPAGQTLGLVGKTGAGKSTIFKLLNREYDNYQGSIQYGGQDIKAFSLDALANSIGYVPQENFLFSATVRDNIRFGAPDLSDEEVIKYAKLADVHEDILNFSEGYDTRVGEKGVSLSGGQKQRLAIARALATEPEYLILDDSLSAVDASTEAQILKNLTAARQDKTTLIATHRMSAIMNANEILVLEDGHVVERGQHEDLMAEQGWYYDMYNEQQLQKEVTEKGGEDHGEQKN